MANEDTVKAIEDNLTAILVAQGFKVEDLSIDPDADTMPLAVLVFEGEEFEYNHGEKPKYNDARYTVAIRYSDKATASARDKAVGYSHSLRANVTVGALNAGDLATSKLVCKVNHDGYEYDYKPPQAQIAYRLRVRYREL